VISLVEDAHGNPLDVSRKQRTVSTALLSRDRGCSFPGCHRKHYLDAHHLRHWARGGETSIDNLTLLCTHHHRMLPRVGLASNEKRTAPCVLGAPMGARRLSAGRLHG